MTDVQPAQIIEAFDRCLVFFFGSRYAREAPFKEDVATAQKWIDAGCDVIIATIIFAGRMEYMHERHLRVEFQNDRANVPHALKIFDDNIFNALRREGVGGVIDAWEAAESQWRARMAGWKKKKVWLREMWGPAPGENGCRVPKRFL